tara:strand:- start:5049 stop:5693 length:645 start_codon:yes stop_codon:yes gene_type:complete
MLKPQTASASLSRDDIVVYTSAADIADFIANGSPGNSAPWNTYPHFAKNNNDDDMDIEENVGITVEGETEVISVVVTGDGASHQFGILNYNLFDYQDAESGTITFKYFFPTGHAAIGKYWHVGFSEKDYTAKPVQIVGNAWTTATLQYGKKHGGGRDKENRSARFLCIKDSNGAPLEESGTTFTGTGTFHLKDIIIVGEVPSLETNSQTNYDGL